MIYVKVHIIYIREANLLALVSLSGLKYQQFENKWFLMISEGRNLPGLTNL